MAQIRPFRRQPAEVDLTPVRQRANKAQEQQKLPPSMPPDEEDDRPVADLRRAPSKLPKTSRLRIGDILKEMGLATDEQIEEAIARQRETRQRLGRSWSRTASSPRSR